MGTRSTSKIRTFDPAHDGFGFRNPIGKVPNRTGGKILCRFDSFLYWRGLCFGMAAVSLLYFADRTTGTRHPPLAELPLTSALLDVLQKYHSRQFWPRAVFATVRDWVASGGGRPESVLGRVRLAGASPDPHVLCFGPALNRRFLSCFLGAHAVAPYRVEGGRVYVYDPNHPGDRGRFVEFWQGGAGKGVEFTYGGFRSREGWGITLVPLSALGESGRLLVN
jgi:hypothetical protein